MTRQINPNSLANLSMPKPKKENYGYRYAIPQDKIDELFSYIAKGESLKKASQSAGICYHTAKKYYKQGDAKRGIQPLIRRLEVFNQKISSKTNVLIEEQRMERINFIRDIINKTKETMFKPQTFYDKEGLPIDVYDENGKKIKNFSFKSVSIKQIENLIRLEAFLCGTSKTKEVVEENTMMTADEISLGE